jgi:NAD(P)-dependent dehydrogenase (short-subunit alcohol dehydrogenase family)
MAQLPRQEKAPMKRMLDAKIALVAGRNSGIGWASAILFAQEGARVALTSRNAAEGEAVVAEIVGGGGEAIFIQRDLALAGAASAVIAQVVPTWGRLGCAFNDAWNQRRLTVVGRR